MEYIWCNLNKIAWSDPGALITCKSCNSICGHEFDYSIANFLNHIQLSLEGPNSQTEIIVNNISLNATIENKAGSPCIIVKEKFNNPNNWEIVKNSLEQKFKFKVNTSSKWNLTKLFRALIKMAQLMSLPQEDYRYILNDCGKMISDIILGKYDEDLACFIRIISSMTSNTDLPKGYCTVTFGETEVRCCFIKLQRKKIQGFIYLMVILPSDNCSWPEFVETTKRITELAKHHSFNMELKSQT